MIFNRYKEKEWSLAYEHARSRLSVFVELKTNIGIVHEAQLLLEAHYRGPWRMIAALVKRELSSLYLHYVWPKWEWIRVKVFRRPQDEALAAVERVEQEEQQLDDLSKWLDERLEKGL